jgi:predicted tellurium resistance membrane protein TerC
VFLSAMLYAIRALAALGGEAHRDGPPPRARRLRRVLPVSDSYHGPWLIVRENGRRRLTPLFLVVVTVATSDMLFAPDPGDPYVLFTATGFALMTVIPLQFLLPYTRAGELLRLGRLLALVLALICIRMLLTGAAEMGLTRIGPVQLPSEFAESVWISVRGAKTLARSLNRGKW